MVGLRAQHRGAQPPEQGRGRGSVDALPSITPLPSITAVATETGG